MKLEKNFNQNLEFLQVRLPPMSGGAARSSPVPWRHSPHRTPRPATAATQWLKYLHAQMEKEGLLPAYDAAKRMADLGLQPVQSTA